MMAVLFAAWLIATMIGVRGLPQLNDASSSSIGSDENIIADAEVDPYCSLLSSSTDDDEDTSKTLNVHLVPHTHDDVGWLKTVDQYYYGLNDTIQHANVSAILDSVLTALQDPTAAHDRTFTYVETKFFSKWYASLPPSSRASIKALVTNKRFNFANGGWCMHDEAATHFMGMIDQTALGHAFLKKELGVVPTVGWQLDPFGHSATQGGLMTSGLGFDSVFFGRMHYVDLESRKREAECEGLWKSSSSSSSSSGDDDSSVFWGLSGSYSGNYGPPTGFCFDASCGDDYKPIVDQPEDVVLGMVQNFTHLLGVQANQTKGRNLMITWGLDFYFSKAGQSFRNIDLLIDMTRKALADGSINVTDIFGQRFDNVNIFYSNPERYTKCKYVDAVHAERQRNNKDDIQVDDVPATYDPATWQVNAKTGDFFPYADCDHCYWAGYYSSRQGFKRMERAGSSFLHAARQIEVMSKLQSYSDRPDRDHHEHEELADTATMEEGKPQSPSDETLARERAWTKSPLYTLDDAIAIAQHHDAITGTAKQHVSNDYAKRISAGISDASSFVTDALRELLLESQSATLENLSYCHLLNETICELSQDASMHQHDVIYTVVYNALAHARSEVVPLPVNSSSSYFVERLRPDMEWSAVDSSLVPNMGYTKSTNAAQFTLYFKATDLPPLGASVFRVRRVKERPGSLPSVSREMTESNGSHLPRELPPSRLRPGPNHNGYSSQTNHEIEISNGVLSVTFHGLTGVVKAISDQREGGISVSIGQEYGFYEGFCFHEDDPSTAAKFDVINNLGKNGMPWQRFDTGQAWQNAGAYVLRPTRDQSFHILPPKLNPSSVVVHEFDFITEVHAEFGDGWIKQITRLIDGKDYLEVEYVVGPVPIEDGIGKEVISRYSTNIESGGIFYTDSNGREFMKRERNNPRVFGYDTPEYDTKLEPIAGNYYPVTTGMFIEDQARSLSILVDRSQGGSSLSDGSLELLIQRRLLHDDARGVGEPLNETDIGVSPYPPYGNATRSGSAVIVKGTHRLMIGKNGASQARSRMDESFSPPHVFVASASEDTQVPFRQASLSLLKTSLPENVMVVTFAALDEVGAFLVRLAHQYGKDENETYSGVARVDLRGLFDQDISSISEKTLSANQDRSDWEKKQLRWNIGMKEEGFVEEARRLDDSSIILLKPLEIRTFKVIVS